VQISDSTVLLTDATGGLGQAIARAMSERHGKLILTGDEPTCSNRSPPSWTPAHCLWI
jgi:NAD(P)-dependent dehydrogenase (short-subunit alcohol dehydrogenase family)